MRNLLASLCALDLSTEKKSPKNIPQNELIQYPTPFPKQFESTSTHAAK